MRGVASREDAVPPWVPGLDEMLGVISEAARGLVVSRAKGHTWDRAARVAFFGLLWKRLGDVSYALTGDRGRLGSYL